jgi:membrane AbrB-like protein
MTVATTLLAALAGAALATRLGIPSGALIGAMLAVGLLKITGVPTFDVPAAGRFAVYCAVGWLLGQTFTAESLRQLKAAAVPILACVALFVVFGLVLGWALWQFAGFDAHTAFLSTAPGAIVQIGVLSADSKANVPLVLTVHVLRITSVIIVMSAGLRWLEERG